MNSGTVERLTCPGCGVGGLRVEAYRAAGTEIVEGRLLCRGCGAWYRIECGIGDLLPPGLRDHERNARFASRHGVRDVVERHVESSSGKSSQAAFFRRRAAEYERMVVGGKYAMILDRLFFLDWIEAHLKSGMWVLDCGCGTGRQCIPLARRGIRVIGVDITEEMLKVCKGKVDSLGLGEFVDLIVGDAESPPVKDGSFDAAVLYAILHHLPDKEKAIRNASRALAPGGRFLSLDPHDSPARSVFDFMMRIWKLWDSEASDEPLLSEKQLSRWLSGAGIECVTALSTYFPPHIFNLMNYRVGLGVLRYSDLCLSRVPLLRKVGGIIVAEGKRA